MRGPPVSGSARISPPPSEAGEGDRETTVVGIASELSLLLGFRVLLERFSFLGTCEALLAECLFFLELVFFLVCFLRFGHLLLLLSPELLLARECLSANPSLLSDESLLLLEMLYGRQVEGPWPDWVQDHSLSLPLVEPRLQSPVNSERPRMVVRAVEQEVALGSPKGADVEMQGMLLLG